MSIPKLLFAAGIRAPHKARREKTHEHGVDAKQRPRTAGALHSVLPACFASCHKLRLMEFANVRNGWKAADRGAIFTSMRFVLIVVVVSLKALTRFLFPRANSRSRMPFEEPKRSGRRTDGPASGIPVVPDRPLGMSGGAAAVAEFDE